MWKSAHHLLGFRAKTRDGTFGKVSDFYFDDHSWALRYLVLDTGTWLPGRLLLISPESFDRMAPDEKVFPLKVSRSEIEKSPPVSAEAPVSRQHEVDLAGHYGWTPYWEVPPLISAGMTYNMPSPMPLMPPEGQPPTPGERKRDPHLRSLREVTGYRIEATDGDIGKIEDFVINDADWTIRFLVADTRAWLPGRTVLVSPHWIREIRWEDRHAHVDLTKDQIRRSPIYEPLEPVNEDMEKKLYDYYGRRHPWPAPETSARR